MRRWDRRYGYGPPPFVRWIGCFFLLAFVVVALVAGLVGASIAQLGPWGAIALAIVLFAVVSFAIGGGVRRMTRPLSSLIEAAHKIESGDYSAQVPEWGSPDIRSVARAFNAMTARLKAIDEQRRNFMADVTHELRTPLSVIRGQAEAIADGVYPADASHLAPILDATQTLDRLVDDLRTLVETDSGNLVLHKEPTDIGGLVHDTVESFRAQPESKGLSLTLEYPDKLPTIEVDPARIRQVISNLLSNAIRHTPSGGSVKVTVGSASDQVTITVSDTGAGIPPDLLPHVFERFAKGPNSTGSGLGLAIAHEIVSAHGGQLLLTPSNPTGVSATVVLRSG